MTVKILMAIALYVALVTLVVNSIAGVNVNSGLQGYNNFLMYHYYTNLAIDGVNLSDLNINTISGSWAINQAHGLHATNLKLMNPFSLIPVIGGTPYYEAECLFGDVTANNNSYSESFNVSGVNLNSGDRNLLLMIDMNSENLNGQDYIWWLVINNDELWLQSGNKHIIGGISYQELGDNIEYYFDMGQQQFIRNYDTGFRFPSNSYNYKIGYTVQFDGNKNAIISLYVNDIQVYSNNIPLTWVHLPITITLKRATDIKTNNYDFGLMSTSQIISSKQVDRGFDIWALFDNIFSIMTFQVDVNLVPFFLQFIFFGIYDLGLLYMLAALVRGVSG